MRHRVYGKKLGRDKDQRQALFKGLIRSLLLHGSITTTSAKAKAIRGLVDKVINQAKNKETKRLLATYLVQKDVQKKLFDELIPSLKSRNSGFTSLVKLGPRSGDGAMMVKMELLTESQKISKSEDQRISRSTKQQKEEKVDKQTRRKAEAPKKAVKRKEKV